MNFYQERESLVCSILTLLFAITIFRLYQLQVVYSNKYEKICDRQHKRWIKLPAKRGNIYDCRGRLLASSSTSYSLFARPKFIENKEKVYRELSKIFGRRDPNIAKRLFSKSRFVFLKRWIKPKEAKAILVLREKGLGIVKEERRFYPFGECLGTLIGFVNVDGKGLEGIERTYDKYLNGGYLYLAREVDGLGRSIFVKLQNKKEPSNLILTVDVNIQSIVFNVIKETVKKFKARSGVGIVADPRDGKILAMVAYPSFDPNQFWRYRPMFRRNKAVTDTYEPGSSFKTFLLACALENGAKENDIYFCGNGELRVKDRIIHDLHKFSNLSLEDILVYSSNIGMVKVGNTVGRLEYHTFLKNLGFGKRTGIDFCGEAKGYLPKFKKWDDVTFANICFGQGLSVTPIQLLFGYCAIANGGLLPKPHIVSSIEKNGTLVWLFRPSYKRVMSEETADRVKKILQQVVERGTGKGTYIPGLYIAGKTGTAQKVDPRTKRYSKYVSIFVGFFPAYDPKVAMLVLIDEPRAAHLASVVAVPAFREIAKNISTYLGISPKGSRIFAKTNVSATSEENRIKKNGFPDFRGMPLRKAISLASSLNLKVKAYGFGKVVYQRFSGDVKKGDNICTLFLKP